MGTVKKYQNGFVKPSSRAVKWQKKFRAEPSDICGECSACSPVGDGPPWVRSELRAQEWMNLTDEQGGGEKKLQTENIVWLKGVVYQFTKA